MMKWIWGLFFGRELSTVLNETKTVRVRGTRFTIRKVNVSDYIAGSKMLLQSYETYKTGIEVPQLDTTAEKKIKEHYSHVLVAAVVHPRLTINTEDEAAGKGIHVDKLFIDWDMVTGIYNEVMLLSYGKKKVRQFQSRGTKLSKSIS